MFSGIVEEIGIVAQVDHQKDKSVITIQAQKCLAAVAVGDSISINGVCLTAVQIFADSFMFEAMPETLRLTNLKNIATGDYVNVERAMTALTRIGGHLVQGHSDGVTTIESIEPDGCALKIWFKKLDLYKDCFIPKGYISIDGMSLTLIDSTTDFFSVCFIPHTQAVTVVQNYRVGTLVNVEVDHIVKTISFLLRDREDSYGKHR
jgi:riboflavin synthase